MADLKSYLATAATVVALATGPAHGADKVPTLPKAQSGKVTAETQKKVADLKLEFPKFKLGPDEQKCLDGTLNDPECDSAINEEIALYRKEQQVNAKEQQVNAKEQQVNAKEQQLIIVKSARDNIDIVIGLVQLGLYIDFDRIPPQGANYMEMVMTNNDIPKSVKGLFSEFLERKKTGGTFTWKSDGERLMNLANKHLQLADGLMLQITDEKFKKQISAMFGQASSSYAMGKQMLTKKS